MKSVILSVLLLVAAAVAATENCYNDVNQSCGPVSNNLDLPTCNSLYGGFHGVSSELQAFANLYLERSYEYLLAATYFNNYQTNRMGFSKLFRKLSDNAWAKSIEIMKQITKRGGQMDFTQHRSNMALVNQKNFTVELHELGALARALDVEKELAERAFHIHREATRNRDQLHDAEISQYLEEEFIEYQAGTIRQLAGHTNDLKKFISDQNGQDLSLALYLFDEYLAKTV